MMTVVIESDHVMYLSTLNMRSDWFFLVLITFRHCSLQTKTSKKAVLWRETERTMPLSFRYYLSLVTLQFDYCVSKQFYSRNEKK